MVFTGLEFLQFAVGRYSIMCIEVRKYCIIFSPTITMRITMTKIQVNRKYNKMKLEEIYRGYSGYILN